MINKNREGRHHAFFFFSPLITVHVEETLLNISFKEKRKITLPIGRNEMSSFCSTEAFRNIVATGRNNRRNSSLKLNLEKLKNLDF
jgi:hypothetical protein